jgi:hypothetical protein
LVADAANALASFLANFPPAVAKVYMVTFRTLDDCKPSKFMVLDLRYASYHTRLNLPPLRSPSF